MSGELYPCYCSDWSTSHSVFPVSLRVLVCTCGRTILRKIASHQLIQTVIRAGVRTAVSFSTVLRAWTQTARGFFYVGFSTEPKSVCMTSHEETKGWRRNDVMVTSSHASKPRSEENVAGPGQRFSMSREWVITGVCVCVCVCVLVDTFLFNPAVVPVVGQRGKHVHDRILLALYPQASTYDE